ncbi:Uncharacterised protein [Mycobacteroides abscessus subsp. abscessus]|nr:Uncharacterised protein [Mycobacteroides abscessus subsp. abscessus]
MVTSRTRSSSLLTARGVNALDTNLRNRVCSGGSTASMAGGSTGLGRPGSVLAKTQRLKASGRIGDGILVGAMVMKRLSRRISRVSAKSVKIRPPARDGVTDPDARISSMYR